MLIQFFLDDRLHVVSDLLSQEISDLVRDSVRQSEVLSQLVWIIVVPDENVFLLPVANVHCDRQKLPSLLTVAKHIVLLLVLWDGIVIAVTPHRR